MTNSSDAAKIATLAALGTSGGFRPLKLYGDVPTDEPEANDLPDPLAMAQAQAFEQGFAEGQAQARNDAQVTMDARGELARAFERLDREMEEELRLALRETVLALCEGALAPLALDEDALLGRIEKAVAMLSRSYDERTIRLNPEDLTLLTARLKADWTVLPDPSLPRGTLRVESTEGGIEDGPATWRRAIADALGPC